MTDPPLWHLFDVFGVELEYMIVRSDDLSGWGKALWTIGIIAVPFFGVFLYLIVNGGDMNRRAESDAQAMADAITYRGPDAGGVWVDEHAGVAFGHRRLAVIDLSDAAAQPMVSPRACSLGWGGASWPLGTTLPRSSTVWPRSLRAAESPAVR